MARAFWQHKTSGDVYAVELHDDGTAWAAVGPIYYSDVTQAYLDDLDVSTEEGAADDAAWLNNQSVRILEDVPATWDEQHSPIHQETSR